MDSEDWLVNQVCGEQIVVIRCEGCFQNDPQNGINVMCRSREFQNFKKQSEKRATLTMSTECMLEI